MTPLPDEKTKIKMISDLLKEIKNNLSEKDIKDIAKSLQNYSASDLVNLVKEAVIEPLRSLSSDEFQGMSKYHVRDVNKNDFIQAKNTILPTITSKDVVKYIEWEKKLGK